MSICVRCVRDDNKLNDDVIRISRSTTVEYTVTTRYSPNFVASETTSHKASLNQSEVLYYLDSLLKLLAYDKYPYKFIQVESPLMTSVAFTSFQLPLVHDNIMRVLNLGLHQVL
jgi:hypothetical protein